MTTNNVTEQKLYENMLKDILNDEDLKIFFHIRSDGRRKGSVLQDPVHGNMLLRPVAYFPEPYPAPTGRLQSVPYSPVLCQGYC